MYNHYTGNTGKVRRVEEPHPAGYGGKAASSVRKAPPGAASSQNPPALPAGKAPHLPTQKPPQKRPPSPSSGLSGELGKLLARFSRLSWESEDRMLLLILYLMYRESGDEELLWIIAAMVFL